MVVISGPSFSDLAQGLPLFGEVPDISACTADLFGLLQGGGAFQNPLQGPIADCLAAITDILGVPGFPTSGPGFDEISAAQTAFTDLDAHGVGLIANMPGLLSTGKNLLGSSNQLNAVGLGPALPPNPCNSLDGIMGSVLGAANDAINALGDLIGPIAAVIGAGLAAVLAAIATVAGPLISAAGAILSIIADEVANLASFLGDVLNFSFANSVPNLASDPCMQTILNALGTPDLLTCLSSGVPGFPIL